MFKKATVDENQKLQLKLMHQFVDDMTLDDAKAAAEFYNEHPFMQFIVNCPMIWFEMGMVDYKGPLSKQERADHTKALITNFLIKQFGKEPFEREL